MLIWLVLARHLRIDRLPTLLHNRGYIVLITISTDPGCANALKCSVAPMSIHLTLISEVEKKVLSCCYEKVHRNNKGVSSDLQLWQ